MSAKDFPMPGDTRYWSHEDFLRLEEMRGEGPSVKRRAPQHDIIGWAMYAAIIGTAVGLFIIFGAPKATNTTVSNSSDIFRSPVR